MGCAGVVPPPPDVAERARAAASYNASLRVSLRGKDVRGATRALVAFRRPDALRLEIPGPAGARLVAVASEGTLTAVFPGERAVLRSAATAEGMEALTGLELSPRELIDLLVGVPPPRLRAFRVRWGGALPSWIEATLPDGARLTAVVESAEAGRELEAAAFVAPLADGYRSVEGTEARRLLGLR